MFLVVSDIHLYESNSYRVKAFNLLLKKLKTIRKKFKVDTLIITGDFFNKYTSISISTILKIASFFKGFKSVVLVCGNHDTPYRDTKESLLDIFSLLPSVTVINSSLYLEDSKIGYIAYYQRLEEIEWLGEANIIFTHKDIKELNKFHDEDFAISISSFPQDAVIFNGHLHYFKNMPLKEGGEYIQLGSPYPTRFSDASILNRFAYIVNPDVEVEAPLWRKIPLNICSYEGHNLSSVDFEIPYSGKEEIEEMSVGDLEELRIKEMTDIVDAFQKLTVPFRIKRMGRRILEYVISSKVEPDQL